MKVQELIEALQKFDSDGEVIIYNSLEEAEAKRIIVELYRPHGCKGENVDVNSPETAVNIICS